MSAATGAVARARGQAGDGSPVVPLYLTAKGAAEYAGIGEGAIRAYMDGQDPPPMLVVGSRRYVQRAGLRRYLEERQTWRYVDDVRRGR